MFDNLNIQAIKVSKNVIVSEEDIKADENAELQEGEDQEKNFYSSGEQILKLETQIKELQDENSKLKTEKVKLKFRMVLNRESSKFRIMLMKDSLNQSFSLLLFLKAKIY